MAHVLGVSMPRSGHHLLEMILKNTLGDKFSYCEFYEESCCKFIPCQSKASKVLVGNKLFLQKSHDFDLSDPIWIPRSFRVVQYRSPVSRSLSNYELYLRNGAEDNIGTFRRFLVDEALYFCKFYKKWIERPSAKILILTYEELTADPLRALVHFFRFIKLPVDIDKLSEGIAQSIGRRGRDNAPFIPNEVLSHRYAKYPVLANFEQIIIRNCSGYFPIRYFSSADPDNSQIGIIFRAKKAIDAADRELAVALAEAAYAQDHDPALVRLCDLARSIPATLGSGDLRGTGALPESGIRLDLEQRR
jgi:hypothetical protein